MNDQMQYGVIKRFFGGKGYGFISPEGGGDDIFFHYSQVTGAEASSLREGQRVSFSVIQGPKGQQANDVKVVNE